MYHGRITPPARASRCHHERDRPVSNATSTTRAARCRPPPPKCRSSRAAQCASRAAPSFPVQARNRSRAAASSGGSWNKPSARAPRGGPPPPNRSPPLSFGRLYVGGPPVSVGRGGRRPAQRPPQPPLPPGLGPLARFDRGPAREAGGEALEPVRPTAEPAA